MVRIELTLNDSIFVNYVIRQFAENHWEDKDDILVIADKFKTE